MSNLIKTKAIVLHEMTIKENDKRILLFSLDYGKMVVFANGAKKAKSPLLAGTQPFVFGEFYLYQGASSYTLRQVDIIESFYELRNSMESLSYGLYFLEVIASVIQEEDPNQDLLRLLYITLMTLKEEQVPHTIISAFFECRALYILGFAPNAEHMVEVEKVSESVASAFREVYSTKLSRLFLIQMADPVFFEFRLILSKYFIQYVGNDFRSLEFLKSISKG